MRDRSKQLLVINTGKKQSEQAGMPSQSGTTHIIGGGGFSVNMSDYLLKSIWDKVFEIRTDSQGIEYIFGKLPVITQYGITMYSGDGVDIPSLASGLPFDGRTIWYNPDTQQIEVIGGTGGGGGEGGGVSNFWDLNNIPSWITNSKPKYSYSEIEGTPDLSVYALGAELISLSAIVSGKADKSELSKYIPIQGYTDILGEKNFTGGLKVNGSPIYYDTEKKYWKLEGDLLVTGGVTMYGNEGTYTPSTIMDAILYDESTLGINSNGQLYVKGGGTSGGGLDITALQNYLTQNSYLNVTSGDNRYLKLSGGMINGEDNQVPLKISNTASTLRIGFARNDELLGYLGFIEANKPLFYDTDGNGRILLHEKNYSSYALPLTGGRIVGKLQIQRTPSNIAFYNDDNVLWGHIGFNAANNAVVWDRSGANEYEILHRGNYSSYALPLSGGTLANTSAVPLTINANNDGQTALFLQSKGNNKTYVGWDTSRGSCLYEFASDSSLNILNGIPRFNTNTLWHSGNDGSGSGLDADLLDGKHLSDIIRYEGLNNNGNAAASAQTITYWGEGNWGHGSTYGTSLNIQGAGSWNHRIDFRTDGILDYYQGINTGDMTYIGAIAFTSSNVASATKLQTTRTIWGQSFDGTGNVNGNMTGVGIVNSFLNIKQDNSSVSHLFLTNPTSNVDYGHIYVSNYDNSRNDRPLVLQNGYGNVGIGIINPSYKLDVNGITQSTALRQIVYTLNVIHRVIQVTVVVK